jgi:hypothetical protein
MAIELHCDVYDPRGAEQDFTLPKENNEKIYGAMAGLKVGEYRDINPPNGINVVFSEIDGQPKGTAEQLTKWMTGIKTLRIYRDKVNLLLLKPNEITEADPDGHAAMEELSRAETAIGKSSDTDVLKPKKVAARGLSEAEKAKTKFSAATENSKDAAAKALKDRSQRR